MMIFMGISQDNAHSLIWWVYMAAGYGVLLRHRKWSVRVPRDRASLNPA